MIEDEQVEKNGNVRDVLEAQRSVEQLDEPFVIVNKPTTRTFDKVWKDHKMNNLIKSKLLIYLEGPKEISSSCCSTLLSEQ